MQSTEIGEDYHYDMLTVTLPAPGSQTTAKARPLTTLSYASAPTAGRPAAPFVSHLHYYGIPPPPRIPWLAMLFSAALHAGLIVGFSYKSPPPKRVVVDDAPLAMLMMPDLKEDEEDKPKELNDDEPMEAPSVAVPMLADIPVLVPVDAAFTQLRDLTVPTKIEGATSGVISIPLHIQRGAPDSSGIKDLFNIGDLDRRPEPIVQNPPTFPFELKKDVTSARVQLGFIVTSKGDVIMVYVISSTHRGFERSALEGVAKWKFKPGMRNGKKVNTRVQQAIDFLVEDAN
ncbi:MAG: TonB family protein [Opitutae bacterium]